MQGGADELRIRLTVEWVATADEGDRLLPARDGRSGAAARVERASPSLLISRLMGLPAAFGLTGQEASLLVPDGGTTRM
jgi:hypothetical protein